jgi:hypothetical protein
MERLWRNRRTFQAFFWRDSEKSRKASVRITAVSAEIPTEHFQNKSSERYRYAKSLGRMVLTDTKHKLNSRNRPVNYLGHPGGKVSIPGGHSVGHSKQKKKCICACVLF